METEFHRLLREAINGCSMENGSDTPDFILATYMEACLRAFDEAVNQRGGWYTRTKPPWPSQRLLGAEEE